MITPEDRILYPGYIDSTIVALKVMRALTTEELLRVVNEPHVLEGVRTAIGADTNPTWVEHEALEVLCFERDAISVSEYDRRTL